MARLTSFVPLARVWCAIVRILEVFMSGTDHGSAGVSGMTLVPDVAPMSATLTPLTLTINGCRDAALLVIDQRGRLVRIFDYAEQQLALDYARYLAGAD